MQSTVRPNVLSARTSQNTVRRVSEQSQTKTPTPVGLGSGLESPKDDVPIPRTKGDFGTFDGEWASNSEEVEQEWDDNLGRTVTVRKRRQPADKKTGTPPLRRGRRKVEIIEDRVVTPTNATKALRAMAHRDRAAFYAPSEIAWASHSNTGSSANDSRRCSGMSAKSTKSNASTVVEAILVDAPSIPQRRQTLRHVRKHVALRDSGSDRSPSSSVTNSYVKSEDSPRRPRPLARPTDSRHNSYASNTTSNSMSSGRARREVWKNGGIPVIVVPDRRSSVKSKSSREPSLRSTSSRRSKRSASLSSASRANGSKTHDLSTPIFDRPGRRSRTMSESDGSSQRTIDYPPVIPRRSSSLSAPTSRNTSRAGSLTAESLKSRNALLNQPSGHETRPPPALTLQRAASSETDNGHHHRDHKLNVDRHGDPFFGKRLDTHNTPFSAASVETNGTAPEVSEAKAVNLYPHQNSSVLVVNHSNKPSESSEASQTELSKTPQRPTITTTAPDGEGPVTPPQGLHSMDDVDSPLRNPRAAPPVPPVIPPAIQFIPATPSGLTPHHERQKTMGNYFETMTDDQPHRSGSILRRALSRRRNSETYPPRSARPGLLTRTLSLTRRGSSSGSSHKADAALETPCTCPECEAPPPEDDRLHPHWRPAYSDPEDDMWEREMQDEPISKVYRYAPLDDRPQGPRRSISARMKKTFAILPSRGDGLAYSPPVQDEPERRTIRRTDSGSLRVMRRRSSLDSLRDQSYNERPRASRYDEEGGQEEQGGQEEAGPRRRRRFSMSGTLEGLQSIPRQFNERKREKRTQELRQKISGPREVRDGVGDVIRRNTYRDAYHRAQTASINF